MRSLIFDSSTVITLAMNNLLWMLKPLRKRFKGEFYIPLSVKKEIVDVPMNSKKFKFEAMQVLKVIDEGDLKVFDDSKYKGKVNSILKSVNRIYHGKKKRLKVLHEAEIAALVLAKELKSDAVVIDERTTRMLVETPLELGKLLMRKMHRDVEVDEKELKLFLDEFKGIKVIRSVELGVVAYELGLLDDYLIRNGRKRKELRKDLLDALLWGVKLRGCAISVEEINSILAIERV
jgi:predicted nucleic acid-binding protein